jgi:hypothetical protein
MFVNQFQIKNGTFDNMVQKIKANAVGNQRSLSGDNAGKAYYG